MEKVRSLVLFTIVLLSTIGRVAAQVQDVLSRVEDGRFIIELDKRWSAETRSRAQVMYELDSAMVAKVLSDKAGAEITAISETWSVKKIDSYRYEISKTLEGMSKGYDWGKVWIADPSAQNQMEGPGYPDPVATVFGFNNFKGNTFSQSSSGKVKIQFKNNKNARNILITGSFNNWSTSGIPMKQTADGWEVNLDLKPGKYFYKFIANGQWMYDGDNINREPDGYESYNSVFYVTNKRFELQGFAMAKEVILSGSFNGWNRKEVRMSRTDTGWFVDVYLRDGTHTYKFLVDGNWVYDEANPKRVPDGYGSQNSVIAHGEPILFSLKGYTTAEKVILSGNFNGWHEDELLMEKTETGWQLPYALATGNYEYRYIVDGQWVSDPNNPYRIDHGDHNNSFKAVNPNHKFTLKGFSPSAKVLVTGSFTGWSNDNNVMVRSGDEWIFPMYISPGKHHYKFVVNGAWIVDPGNPYFEDNEFRTGNSVLWIEAPQAGKK